MCARIIWPCLRLSIYGSEYPLLYRFDFITHKYHSAFHKHSSRPPRGESHKRQADTLRDMHAFQQNMTSLVQPLSHLVFIYMIRHACPWYLCDTFKIIRYFSFSFCLSFSCIHLNIINVLSRYVTNEYTADGGWARTHLWMWNVQRIPNNHAIKTIFIL